MAAPRSRAVLAASAEYPGEMRFKGLKGYGVFDLGFVAFQRVLLNTAEGQYWKSYNGSTAPFLGEQHALLRPRLQGGHARGEPLEQGLRILFRGEPLQQGLSVLL